MIYSIYEMRNEMGLDNVYELKAAKPASTVFCLGGYDSYGSCFVAFLDHR
mgnify:CR=1 FL=1